MPTFTSDARRSFYDRVWPRALINGKNHWCRLGELLDGTPGLVPLEHDDRVLPWPLLETGEPGWAPTSEKIEAAFTAVLKTNLASTRGGPVALGLGQAGDNDARRRLHLAEQHLDPDELRPWVADLLLQVAVFGQVVMS